MPGPAPSPQDPALAPEPVFSDKGQAGPSPGFGEGEEDEHSFPYGLI